MPDIQSRKLVAILAADIAGYSALMGADEETTVRALKGHQAIVLPMIPDHGGRVIDTAGDGIMAEFASVLNAVRCAVAIQGVMAKRNAAIDPPQQMHFRIGINLGDVIYDDTRIYGDGINIAARLESIAQPGGICISDKVHQEIRGKIDIVVEDIGLQTLKNIAEPVRVHRIVGGAAAPTPRPVQKPALTLPDKPSIAVLPFDNLSGDAGQDYFSDGITEDIITELSRSAELFVIARNSSFQYKGESHDIRRVGIELGVHYVLEGSIRRARERVRITAQLIDAKTGAHTWANRYDRDLEDIFAVQDEVARTIVSVLAAHVSKAEAKRTLLKPASSWQAHDYYLQGAETFAAFRASMSLQKLQDARSLLQKSVAIDPGYARACTVLSKTYIAAWVQPLDAGYLDPECLDLAHQWALKGVQLDPNLPQAHSQLGWVLIYRRTHDAALAAFERAIDLNPNFTDCYFSAALAFAGEPQRALDVAKSAMRLDPFYEPLAPGFLGLASYMLRRYDEAVRALTEASGRAPNLRSVHLWLAATYARMGRSRDAKNEAAEVLRLEPSYSIGRTSSQIACFRRDEDAEHFFGGLRSAGLPE